MDTRKAHRPGQDVRDGHWKHADLDKMSEMDARDSHRPGQVVGKVTGQDVGNGHEGNTKIQERCKEGNDQFKM